jgi:hypothetical protein
MLQWTHAGRLPRLETHQIRRLLDVQGP